MAFLSGFPPPPPSNPSNFSFSSASPPPQSSSVTLPPPRRRRSPAFSFPNPLKHPKRLVYVDQVKILARKKLPNSIIAKHLTPLQGRKVPVSTILSAVEAVNSWFIDNGYVCSRLIILRMPGFFRSNLICFSAEPRLTAIRRVPVDKDGKPEEASRILTRERTIANAIGMQIGDVFVWKPVGLGALMALGIFEYANAEVNIIDNEKVELVLNLRERRSGRIEPGAGMSSDGRVYGDLSIVDNNFGGRAQRLRIEWQKRLDVGRSAGGIAFEDMRVGAKIPLAFRIRAYRDSNSSRSIPAGRVTRYIGQSQQRSVEANVGSETPLRYEKDRDGIMMDLGYRPRDTHMLLNLTPMLELVHPQLADQAGGPSAAQMVLQTAFTHATRLPVELPRFGHIARIEQSVGSCLSNPKEAFHKTIVRLSQYFGIGSVASVAAGSTIGIGSDNLPWHEQKSLGGPSSVRGYDYGELGRYKSFGHGRIELRVPLTGGQDVAVPDRKETVDKAPAEGTGPDDDQPKDENGNILPSNLFEKFPPLVGVIFGDVAVAERRERDTLGASYGIGLRIGGMIAVNWCRTVDDGRSRLHFGLVDKSL